MSLQIFKATVLLEAEAATDGRDQADVPLASTRIPSFNALLALRSRCAPTEPRLRPGAI